MAVFSTFLFIEYRIVFTFSFHYRMYSFSTFFFTFFLYFFTGQVDKSILFKDYDTKKLFRIHLEFVLKNLCFTYKSFVLCSCSAKTVNEEYFLLPSILKK